MKNINIINLIIYEIHGIFKMIKGGNKNYCTRVEFSELKIPYNTVVVVDFADSECEASAKSCYST